MLQRSPDCRSKTHCVLHSDFAVFARRAVVLCCRSVQLSVAIRRSVHRTAMLQCYTRTAGTRQAVYVSVILQY